MTARRLTSLMVVFLIATGTMLHGESKILIAKGQKIAFLGDSITANGWGQPGGYVKLVVDGLAKEGIVVTPIPAKPSQCQSSLFTLT